MVVEENGIIGRLKSGSANPYNITKGKGGPCYECAYKNVPKTIYPCNVCSIHNSKFIWRIKDE